jgi:hypothetical protein
MGPCSGGVERERYDGTAVVFGVIDGDRAAQLFGGVLDLPEIIGQGTIEINTGITDADHSAVAILSRFDMDAFVLGAANGAVEEVPEHEGQEVFVGAKFKFTVNLVDDDRLSADGAGEEASH